MGVIEFLLSDCPEAIILRNTFVFKPFPMLNPDGVINGNYRCSLAGCDLNRRYLNPSPHLHPTIFALKKFTKSFTNQHKLALYCDLHGHSRRKNIFMYGNRASAQDPTLAPSHFRLFPYIMSKLLTSFDYSAWRFSCHKSKEGTARVAVFRDIKTCNIFTMEASFCGVKDGTHFGTKEFKKAGETLM